MYPPRRSAARRRRKRRPLLRAGRLHPCARVAWTELEPIWDEESEASWCATFLSRLSAVGGQTQAPARPFHHLAVGAGGSRSVTMEQGTTKRKEANFEVTHCLVRSQPARRPHSGSRMPPYCVVAVGLSILMPRTPHAEDPVAAGTPAHAGRAGPSWTARLGQIFLSLVDDAAPERHDGNTGRDTAVPGEIHPRMGSPFPTLAPPLEAA
jgi:hypothetical protein